MNIPVCSMDRFAQASSIRCSSLLLQHGSSGHAELGEAGKDSGFALTPV